MKTFVIGLDCAAPEILFHHPGLNNIRALMERGCYGRLESVIPPITVPAITATLHKRPDIVQSGVME